MVGQQRGAGQLLLLLLLGLLPPVLLLGLLLGLMLPVLLLLLLLLPQCMLLLLPVLPDAARQVQRARLHHSGGRGAEVHCKRRLGCTQGRAGRGVSVRRSCGTAQGAFPVCLPATPAA